MLMNVITYKKSSKKNRRYIYFFYNGEKILSQKVPFDDKINYGYGDTAVVPLYYENGKIYQKRVPKSNKKTRLVSFPIKQQFRKIIGKERVEIVSYYHFKMIQNGFIPFNVNYVRVTNDDDDEIRTNETETVYLTVDKLKDIENNTLNYVKRLHNLTDLTNDTIIIKSIVKNVKISL
jgi:hypothetical protein